MAAVVRRTVGVLFPACVLVAFPGPARAQGGTGDLPRVLNAVHCEPQNANNLHWIALAQIVNAADQRNLKLSIQLSPQWVDMVVADPGKLEALWAWHAAGHEIGGHHHTLDHDRSWDGYSNDPDAPDSNRPPGFRGDMADYAEQLQRVAPPGERIVVVSAKDYDYPPTIPYQTGGQTEPTTEDAVSVPTLKVFYGQAVWNILHAPLVRGNESYVEDIEALYLQASPEEVIGVAFHPFNWRNNSGPILAWFDFLAAMDPAGAYSKTAEEILGPMVIPGDVDRDDDVDLIDFSTFAAAYGTCQGEPGYNGWADFDADGCVSIIDFSTLSGHFGLVLAGP